MKFRQTSQSEINLLDLTPQQSCEYDIDEEGLVTVKIPRFKSEALRYFLVPRWKSPYVHMRLDRFGSFVWMQCDGSRTIGVIGERMVEEFGEDVEPVYERLRAFFHQLSRNTFITLRLPDGSTLK